jgi:exosortase/archaeosortase family protein
MKKKLPQGFRELLIKSAIFVVLFIVIQLITMGIVSRTTLPGELKLFAMDDLAEAFLFMLVIFIGLNRKNILKIKSYSVSLWTRIISGLAIIPLFVLYFQYKKYLLANLEFSAKYIYSLTALEYLMLFLILFLLIVFVFGFKFCWNFFRENKKGLGMVLIGTILVYNFIKVFQDLWKPLSGFVSGSVAYLLSFVGNSSLYYIKELPIIRLDSFVVGIAKTCSGIDSVLLFTGLYLGILAWDWKILNKKKAISMYFVGVVGAFFLNILRIFLLILIGAYISRDFALHTFHTNASAIIFIIYFAIFWKMLYKWMKK